MPVITSISPQKKDKTRCNVELDGRFFCGLDVATAVLHRLKAGMEITPERLSEIQLESEKQTAFDRALHLISYAGKTEREVRDRLARKGYLPEVCDDVVARMKKYGYLDDEAYAREYAESAARTKGARLIEAELKRKGVSDGAIAAALGGIDGEAGARRALEKYLRGKDAADPSVLRKAFAYLVGKGFDYDEARAALKGWGDED